ncbi:MAG TPA: hypothetical protein VK638_14415 [Edaphobacter sp.]|nr:hypothetical protein [Edaphobacter sp.]
MTTWTPELWEGKIDHSSAGAQYMRQELQALDSSAWIGQVLALALLPTIRASMTVSRLAVKTLAKTPSPAA